jgi:hypothetical protein
MKSRLPGHTYLSGSLSSSTSIRPNQVVFREVGRMSPITADLQANPQNGGARALCVTVQTAESKWIAGLVQVQVPERRRSDDHPKL